MVALQDVYRPLYDFGLPHRKYIELIGRVKSCGPWMFWYDARVDRPRRRAHSPYDVVISGGWGTPRRRGEEKLALGPANIAIGLRTCAWQPFLASACSTERLNAGHQRLHFPAAVYIGAGDGERGWCACVRMLVRTAGSNLVPILGETGLWFATAAAAAAQPRLAPMCLTFLSLFFRPIFGA